MSRELFEERLKRQGMKEEFDADVKREVAAGPQTAGRKSSVYWKVAKSEKYGYVDTKGERELRLQWLRSLSEIAVEDSKPDRDEFERSLGLLDRVADKGRELDWIRGHIAMSRKVRNPDLEVILLTDADIRDAPSQSAVHMLQYWVNNPHEFNRQFMATLKKAEGGESEEKEEDSDDIAFIESMLDEI